MACKFFVCSDLDQCCALLAGEVPFEDFAKVFAKKGKVSQNCYQPWQICPQVSRCMCSRHKPIQPVCITGQIVMQGMSACAIDMIFISTRSFVHENKLNLNVAVLMLFACTSLL